MWILYSDSSGRLVDWKRIDEGRGMSTNLPTFSGWFYDQMQSGLPCAMISRFLWRQIPPNILNSRFFFNRNEWFPTCSNYDGLTTVPNVLPMSLWFQSMSFFERWPCCRLINLEKFVPCFAVMALPGGAQGGNDRTSSPSKDASDDTRTCCLPTGANGLKRWILEGETLHKLPETSRHSTRRKGRDPKQRLAFQP